MKLSIEILPCVFSSSYVDLVQVDQAKEEEKASNSTSDFCFLPLPELTGIPLLS